MPEMKDLLEAVAALVADYRKGEIATIDAQDVERWINQFDGAVREPILTELIHVLGKTYFTKADVLKFLETVLTSEKLTGGDHCGFWKSAKFLHILVAEAREQALADTLAAGVGADETALQAGGEGAVAYADALATYLARIMHEA
jgi:hypothetical protein